MLKDYELTQSPFYKLSTKRKLSALLDFTPKELLCFIKVINSYYSVYSYSKPAIVNHPLFVAKPREIQQQKSELERVHRKIYKYINRIAIPNYLQSAIKGRSYETNAEVHKNSDFVYRVDLKGFYKNIKEEFVRRFFVDTMLCPGDVAFVLARICCFNKIMPTGSCLSPILSFWVNKNMFDELYHFANMNNMIMTLYIDDIIFSGKNITRQLMYEIDCIVKKHRYTPHKKKLYGKDQAKIVTGLAIVEGRLAIPHKRRAKMRILLRAFENEKCQKKKNKLENCLWGMVSEAKRFDHELALFSAASALKLSVLYKKRFESLVKNCSRQY
ncbi:MAG: reverse transcriptase family protein [Solidesulfovibrio sp.]